MAKYVEVVELPDSSPFVALMLRKMAFPFMLIATGIMCMANESLQNVIPGHPILSFLVLACGAMLLTFWITRLTLIGSAFSALCCMIILSFVFQMIMDAIEPDSKQYYILLTVIFSAISFVLCYLNLRFDTGCIRIYGLSCIVAGIMNALTAALYILIIRCTWEEYCIPSGGIIVEDKILYDSIVGDIVGAPRGFVSVPGAVAFYIVLAGICLGAFVATIIFRDQINDPGILDDLVDRYL